MLQKDKTKEELCAEISLLQNRIAELEMRDKTLTQAQQELRDSKAFVDAIVENVPLMLFLKEAAELRFVMFNRAGEELLGHDRKDLLGKNDLDFFPAEQAAYFINKDREALSEKTGVVDIPEESITTAKKGVRLLHTRKVCIRGVDGNTKFLLGISEDITDRRKAEDSLEAEHMFSAALLENMEAGVVACNEKGNLILFNRAARAWHGLNPVEIPQAEWAGKYDLYRADGITPMDISSVPLSRAFRGETVHNVGMVIAAKDKPKRSILANAVPIKGENGRILGAVAVMHDVTEQKKYKDDLEKELAMVNHLNKLMVDRELMMVELKNEIVELKEKLKLSR